PPPTAGRSAEAGRPVSNAAVPVTVAVILDAAKWLVSRPPCRIHRRSHAPRVVTGPARGGLPPTRAHAAPAGRARSTWDACHASLVHRELSVKRRLAAAAHCRLWLL